MPNENIHRIQLDKVDAPEEQLRGVIHTELKIPKDLFAGGHPGNVWDAAGVSPVGEAIYKSAKRAARFVGQNYRTSADTKAETISAGLTAAWAYFHKHSSDEDIIARCQRIARRAVYKAERRLRVTDQEPERVTEDGQPEGLLPGDKDYRLLGNRHPDLKACEQNESDIVSQVDREKILVRIHAELYPEDFAFLVRYPYNTQPHTSVERKRMERLRARLRRAGIEDTGELDAAVAIHMSRYLSQNAL